LALSIWGRILGFFQLFGRESESQGIQEELFTKVFRIRCSVSRWPVHQTYSRGHRNTAVTCFLNEPLPSICQGHLPWVKAKWVLEISHNMFRPRPWPLFCGTGYWVPMNDLS
jgi:hypothetical protein